MNRSVKSLLSVSVLAPFAALAVAAAPAEAAPGPSTTLLYETYAAASPVGRTLPKPATKTTGQTAERATHAVDGVLRPRRNGSGVRAARCTAEAGRSGAGTSLPVTPPKAVGQTPLGALTKGDCLRPLPGADRRSTAKAPPARPRTDGVAPGIGGVGGVGDVPGKLLGGLGNRAPALGNGQLGGLTGAGNVIPGGRRTQAPLSMALTDVPSTLGAVAPKGLPAGTTFVPETGRRARPGPADDVFGRANGVVGTAGGGLGRTEGGAGEVVKTLKAEDRVGGSVNGPVSLLDQAVPGGVGVVPPQATEPSPIGNQSGLGVPGAPGLG